MKKIKIVLSGIIILLLSTGIMAQGGDPPPPPGGHGSGDDEEPGGGAPIGSGIFILLSLGAAYGGKKLYELKNEDVED